METSSRKLGRQSSEGSLGSWGLWHQNDRWGPRVGRSSGRGLEVGRRGWGWWEETEQRSRGLGDLEDQGRRGSPGAMLSASRGRGQVGNGNRGPEGSCGMSVAAGPLTRGTWGSGGQVTYLSEWEPSLLGL